jgi:iodothyronine deiodinase-like protein
MAYNYRRFGLDLYDLGDFPGPQVGETAVDVTLTDLTGQAAPLSAFRGQWLVLETGSITCNMYTRNIPGMNALQDKYTDVVFCLVYVREAHPGSKLPQHSNMASKLANAAEVRSECGDRRCILVDDIEGSMHRQYGALPNIVYVIDPEGTVVYRHDWGVVEELDAVLSQREQLGCSDHANTWALKPFSWETNKQLFKTVGRGGWDAIWDLVKVMPLFLLVHLKVDKAYRQRQYKDGEAISNHTTTASSNRPRQCRCQ